MIFEYCNVKFGGTRTEIIKKLKVYLSNQELTWSFDCWRLANETITLTCGPWEATNRLIDKAIDRIPKRYIFKGGVFEDVESLRSYLESLEIRHLGDGVFSLYTYSKRLINNMSLDEIKTTIIEGVINDI